MIGFMSSLLGTTISGSILDSSVGLSTHHLGKCIRNLYAVLGMLYSSYAESAFLMIRNF